MIQSRNSQIQENIPKHVEKSLRLYASDLPDLVYCERLFYMKKTMDIPRFETYPMVRGTNEHEIRRILAKYMIAKYEDCKSIESLEKLDYESVIDSALDYGRELARTTRIVFYLRLEEASSDLKYRLELEEKQRLETAVKMAKKGMDMQTICSSLLPWKYETGVGSNELGITGRIDQVFRNKNEMIPLDFKTHTNRNAALFWKDAHFEQLAIYAMLLEMNYPKCTAKKGIIQYTEDNHNQVFNITKKDKQNVLEHINQAKRLVQIQKLPPKLEGKQSVKCQNCYLRKFCFSVENGDESSC